MASQVQDADDPAARVSLRNLRHGQILAVRPDPLLISCAVPQEPDHIFTHGRTPVVARFAQLSSLRGKSGTGTGILASNFLA